MPKDLEARIAEQVADVLPRAGVEIVDAQDFVTVGDQTIA
jgi:hypothetical protein